MRNFQQLARGLNVNSLLHEITRQSDLWDQNTLRTACPGSPHSQVNDIWLRMGDPEIYQRLREPPFADQVKTLITNGMTEYQALYQVGKQITDEHECIDFPAFAKLPQARQIIFDLMRLVEGERLGRVLITRLGPGKQIPPHVDGGDRSGVSGGTQITSYYSRYHVGLQVLPGVQFRAGNEYAPMISGDVWWFDNSQEHEVFNASADDRLTMIVDIRATPR